MTLFADFNADNWKVAVEKAYPSAPLPDISTTNPSSRRSDMFLIEGSRNNQSLLTIVTTTQRGRGEQEVSAMIPVDVVLRMVTATPELRRRVLRACVDALDEEVE